MMVYISGGKVLSLVMACYLYVMMIGNETEYGGNNNETTRSKIKDVWVSATMSNCIIKEESGDAPQAGDNGCEMTHEAGAVAWSMQRFQQGRNDWLMYCIGNKWTASVGNNKSAFARAGHKWALAQVDTGLIQEDGANPWLRGEHIGSDVMDVRCKDEPPTGWIYGGALMICVEGLNYDILAGAICNKGEDSDTPACATNFEGTTLNSKVISTRSTICPVQEVSVTEPEHTSLMSDSIEPVPAVTWASATMSNCMIQEEKGAAPKAGDIGCNDTHEPGAVAWSMSRFQQDKNDWLMYCIGNKWTASFGNNMSLFANAGHKWAFAQVDTHLIEENNFSPWLRGEHIGQSVLDLRCADVPPTGWVNGGALVICAEALKNGDFVAAMCNKGDDLDTPACTTDFLGTALNGDRISSASTVCPMKRMKF